MEELADLLGTLGHVDRIRLVEALRNGEHEVGHLAEELGISPSRASQHLAVLRAHQVVLKRREGRHVLYRLATPSLAGWVARGLDFIASEARAAADLETAVEEARNEWAADR